MEGSAGSQGQAEVAGDPGDAKSYTDKDPQDMFYEEICCSLMTERKGTLSESAMKVVELTSVPDWTRL